LNTPKALAEIFSISKKISKSENKVELTQSLIGSANLLGLLNFSSDDKKFKKTSESNIDYIKDLIEERKIARGKKDYLESDRIRDILIKLGVEINDN
jgi:cysteinyl-tRNA synthetase